LWTVIPSIKRIDRSLEACSITVMGRAPSPRRRHQRRRRLTVRTPNLSLSNLHLLYSGDTKEWYYRLATVIVVCNAMITAPRPTQLNSTQLNNWPVQWPQRIEKLTSRKNNSPNNKFQVPKATEKQQTTIDISLFCLVRNAVNPFSASCVPNYCCSKGSAPYWSNPPFWHFDIRPLWRSGLSARAPECQKLKMVG